MSQNLTNLLESGEPAGDAGSPDPSGEDAPVVATPAVPAADDLALLRAFEPVVAYTRGEYFLPTDVESYVASCGLWLDGSDDSSAQLVPPGALTMESLLIEAGQRLDQQLYLKYVQHAASNRDVRRWRKQYPTGIRRAGRLAAVGFVARAIDVGLRSSLLIRGSVPGGVMTAAAHQYHVSGGAAASPYYGRVIHDGGYTICQYWYFYAANDWRSTFGGVNDHEADWEMVTVYATGSAEAGYRPAWVAFSSHDYTGDDLRRRWDDPELTLVDGNHPVVFAGAGSHSGAFLPGDYLVTVNPRFLGGFARGWKRTFSFLGRNRRAATSELGFGIPFIDYARGDGVRIGPGAEREWSPVLISDDTPWVQEFRGLWGRDTRDWAGGERAPAGPRYDRGGTVRQSWSDPLGWAGLHKVAPDQAAVADGLRARVGELDNRITELDASAEELRTAARMRQAEIFSLRTEAQETKIRQERAGEVLAAEDSVSSLIRERTFLAEERAVHTRVLATGIPVDPPQAHLRHQHRPYDMSKGGRGALLSVWAAVSVPLLLLTVATILLLPGDVVALPWLLLTLLIFAIIEAIARKRLMTTALSVAVMIVGAAVVLDVLSWLASNARVGFLIAMGCAGAVLLAANIRDFFRR